MSWQDHLEVDRPIGTGSSGPLSVPAWKISGAALGLDQRQLAQEVVSRDRDCNDVLNRVGIADVPLVDELEAEERGIG